MRNWWAPLGASFSYFLFRLLGLDTWRNFLGMLLLLGATVCIYKSLHPANHEEDHNPRDTHKEF